MLIRLIYLFFILQHRKCKHAVGSIDNTIAAGYVEETNSFTLHGTPLREHETPLAENAYHVAVEITFNDNAPLLLPNEDIGASLVGHVIGSCVAWPKFLVIFDDMMVNILSFNLFYLIKNILLTLVLLQVNTDPT